MLKVKKHFTGEDEQHNNVLVTKGTDILEVDHSEPGHVLLKVSHPGLADIKEWVMISEETFKEVV